MPEANPYRRRSYTGPLLGLIALIALVIGGYYAWVFFMQSNPEPTPAPVTQEPVNVMSTFASSTMRFSLTYSREFSLDESFVNTSVVPTKPISGVKFSVPTAMTAGTNLSNDTGLSVEQLPRAKQCTGDIFIAATVKPFPLTQGSTTYSVATSSEGAAGNIYEEIVYAFPSSTPCIAVRYFIHSTAIENHATGTSAFDRAGLIATFDEMRRSIVIR